MNKNDNDILEDEIEIRKKLPQEVKMKIIKSVILNIFMAVLFLGTTLLIKILFNKVEQDEFQKYIKVGQLFFAFITVILFEIAYKKDSMRIGCYAIETGIFSVAILYVPYMFIAKSKLNWMRNILIGYLVYYLVKSIVIILMDRHNYLKDNMSDVKEIVKEESKSYLDEKSQKTLKERKIEKIKKEEKSSKESEKKKTNTCDGNKPKKKRTLKLSNK